MVVQWLGLHASTAGSTGSIPGWELGSHRLCMVWPNKKFNKIKKKKQKNKDHIFMWKYPEKKEEKNFNVNNCTF